MQFGLAPAQRVDAQQHVVADGFVDRAQLEQIEGEGLAVVGRGDEERDAPDLAGVTGFGERSIRWKACPPRAVASPLRSCMRCMSSSMSSGPATAVLLTDQALGLLSPGKGRFVTRFCAW